MANPIRSGDELYDVIERALKNITEPQTAAMLMERVEVRNAATERFGKDIQVAINKLSDRLGFMWRRGVLDRLAAPPTRTMSRWAYAPKGMFKDTDEVVPYIGPGATSATNSATKQKHVVEISEDRNGDITFEFAHFTVTIKPK